MNEAKALMTDTARGFNRCRSCGRFQSWENLEQAGGFYMESIYGDVEEDFYLKCAAGHGCHAERSQA